MFEKGDIIKCIDSSGFQIRPLRKGDVGVVERFESNGGISFKNVKTDARTIIWRDQFKQFEKVDKIVFSAGDKIKIHRRDYANDPKDGIITLTDKHACRNEGWWTCEENMLGYNEREFDYLVEKGGKVSKYELLKEEIGELDDFFCETADEVMTEIGYNGRLMMDKTCNGSSGSFLVITHGERPSKSDKGRYDVKAEYTFFSNNGQMDALKNALMYMLENSKHKKESKKEKLQK